MLKRIRLAVKHGLGRVDPLLFFCSLLLSCISLLTVWGALDNFGSGKFVMQAAMTLLGIVMTVLIANLDLMQLVKAVWPYLLAVSLALLTVTLVFGNSGSSRETANRSWLEIPLIGISIQPSEFVKITFICTFARHLSMVAKNVNRPLTLVFLALHAGAAVGLILLSGDLGVALVYLAVILLMLFCAGLSLWYFLGFGAVFAVSAPFLWNLLADYQKERILYGFNPELDPLGKGYQPLLSRSAIANGGLFGKGLFGGHYYEILPASHTDFIFATICEKFGLLGALLVMVLLLTLVIRIVQIAVKTRRQFGALICVGVAAVIVVQTLENLGMCLAILPVVGITLPFLSCGGSSLLATFMLVGMVHSVASHGTQADFPSLAE